MITVKLSLLGKKLELTNDEDTFIEMREGPFMYNLVIRAQLAKLSTLFKSDLIGVIVEEFHADGIPMFEELWGEKMSSYNKKIKTDPNTGSTLKEITFMYNKDSGGRF